MVGCALVGVALGAACGSDSESGAATDDAARLTEGLSGPVEFAEPQKGGTLRLVTIGDVSGTAGMDPTGEYSHWHPYPALLRTLIGYRFTAGQAGSELVPDAAESLPEVSSDGLTYTLTIRPGIRFGPPVNRDVTSQDFRYAIERIATKGLAQYPGYYEHIVGFREFQAGKAETIAGIETPDERTIVFRLEKPRGDFDYALAMPAAAPIPEEVAGCHREPSEYGRYIIATGPYMIEGSDDLDISSCASQRPISGYRPSTGLTMVRNPEYDPATDSPDLRENFVDRIEITMNTNPGDAFDRVEAGLLDAVLESPTGAVIRRYLRDPSRRDRLRVNSGDDVAFLNMNLTEPPFDDVHVRRAMNYAMDLEGFQRAWGGPARAAIATHIVPPSVLGGRLPASEYHPFQGPPFDGDLEAAKAEMRESRYDTDGDGICDSQQCRDVVLINANLPQWTAMSPIIKKSAAGIGIGLEIREVAIGTAYALLGTPSRRLPIGAATGWAKDYADASTFFRSPLKGTSILPAGNINTPLLGLTPAQASELGVRMPSGGVPSVDADIDACEVLLGEERLDCWEALDRKVTETIVPWVPYQFSNRVILLGPAITKFDFDQFSGRIALVHTAVDPSKQR